MAYLTDDPKCPKCGDKMSAIETVGGLPAAMDDEGKADHGWAVSIADALPMQIHRCVNCRYLEFFAV